MKIGTIDLGERPVFLAPMEDVTDISFRLMCKRFGADMVYTEFVSADALIRSVNKTQQKLNVADEERPVAIQIYGRDVPTMVEAAQICEAAHPDILDINFGCPVKRVAGKGAGAGMLRNIPLMLDITREVVKAVNIPVTVKTRLGWDADNRIIVDLAEQLQDCGIAALSIHGRTRAQMYTGEADWTLIGKKQSPYTNSHHRQWRCDFRRNLQTTFRTIWRGCRYDWPGQHRPPLDFQRSEALSGYRRDIACRIFFMVSGHTEKAGGTKRGTFG